MTSCKLYMVSELPYHKYKDVNVEVKMLTWNLAKAKVEAKKLTAKYNSGFGDDSDAESDSEGYSSNFYHNGSLLTVSAEVVRHAIDIKNSKLAVLKQFVKANSPAGTVIPTTKWPLVEMVYNQLVISDNGRIVYAEDVAKEKAREEATAKTTTSAVNANTTAGTTPSTVTTVTTADTVLVDNKTPELEEGDAKKRKLEE